MMQQKQYSLGELAELVEARIQGDSSVIITGVSGLQTAKPGQISFLDNLKYRKFLSETKADAVIVEEKHLSHCKTNALISNNPQFAFAKIAKLFQILPELPKSIHASSVIGEDCKIHETVSIGANCVIGNRVKIGANTVIHPGTVIGDDCVIGTRCRIWANVTLYYAVEIGHRTEIHSGAVIGADGFGLAQGPHGFEKIPQLGTVIIGEDVEVGANTTIDRGAIENTQISNGVKLDNQIQIGHNVKIGENTVVAGCAGIAGSAKIGKNCMIGGGAGIVGHIEICDQVMITASTGIAKSIKEPGIYSAGVSAERRDLWKKNAMAFRFLGDMHKKIKLLEKHFNLEIEEK